MKSKLFLTVILVICATLVSPAQIKPLQIGDTIPEKLKLKDVFNYHAETLALGDFTGKLIILDFWGTYCIPCLRAFPKIDTIQTAFPDDVQIIAVSRHGYEETASFFATRSSVHKPDIPFVTGDSILHSMFPHQGVPFHVWIDKDGVVLHLADGYHLTMDNVAQIINGNKSDVTTAIQNVYKETVIESEFLPDVLFASYLVRFNPENTLRLEKARTSDDYTSSGDIFTLYQFLYHQLGQLDFNPFRTARTQLEVLYENQYKMPSNIPEKQVINWMEKHFYFYQTVFPPMEKDELFERVKADYERYFPIRSTVEQRELDCWMLVRVDEQDFLKTKGGEATNTFLKQDIRLPRLDSVRQFINLPFSSFLAIFRSYVENISGIPFIDQTGYEGNVDIVFTGESLDSPTIESFRRELNNYGLDLVNGTIKQPVLVLKEHLSPK